MSTSLDFQALLSSLKAKSHDNASTPSMSIPAQMTADTSHQPPHGFSKASPSNPPASSISQMPYRLLPSAPPETTGSTNTTAQGLLSLLSLGPQESGQGNTNQGAGSLKQFVPEDMASGQASPQFPAMSASDLVAKFMNPTTRSNGTNRLHFNGVQNDGAAAKTDTPSQNESQDALLRLLSLSSNSGRSGSGAQKAQSQVQVSEVVNENLGRESTPVKSTSSAMGSRGRRDSPIRLFGTTQSREATPFEAPKLEDSQEQNSQKPIFTYKNPFEALNASRNQNPRPQEVAPRSASPAVKTEPDPSHENAGVDDSLWFRSSAEPTSTRRKLTPKIRNRTPSTAYESIEDNSGDVVEPIQSSHQNTSKADSSNEPTGVAHSSAVPEVPNASKEETNEGPVESESHPDRPQVDTDTSMLKNDLNEAGDVWESADDSPVKRTTAREVPVYNFPIKPFVSITLQPSPTSTVGIRDDGIMEISRLKKEFDQIDRSLAYATSKYISYALVKNGGIRIIRQDDGIDRQVFKNSHDRIFNISLCSAATTAPPSNDQAVLGTGVSGSVYYATVSKEGNDLFEKSMLDTESLVFPPFPLGDENTSGGLLKTRAKRSSRHPEFFGIGRGKNIYIVWPATALSSKYGISLTNRRVDVEKLYNDRALRITTGKAGKDFTFSEDDSLIVSLDKTGRMRFWDIRPLVNEANATAAKVSPINVDTPLLTLLTASPSEKSWPTSVLFVDKVRPYTKGGALRYILVGMRQNHTLQLWDVALGKAVQELNFPHEAESDGICSVNYHPNSGIIVIGHPTRNSIYFIHLSAPKYALAPMSQATYISRIANKDPEIPKPESTACMSGLREISFVDKGHLRSVELLPIHKPTDASKTSQPQALFELYVVHSKGVTCLNITKEDLGWSSDSKVLNPVDAVAEGLITLKDLRLGGFVDELVDSKSQSEEPPQPARPAKKKSAARVTRQSEEAQKLKQTEVEASQVQETHAITNGSISNDILIRETPQPKESKKHKKNVAGAPPNDLAQPQSRGSSPTKETLKEEASPFVSRDILSTAPMDPDFSQRSNNSPFDADDKIGPVPQGISGDRLDKELKKFENGVSGEFRKELNNLYQNLQNDRNIQDSASVARQEAVLRLVSTTLSTNIEKSLSRMISAQMQQVVVPAITGVTVQAVTAQVGEAVARVLHQLVPHELATQMPVAINTALQSPQISRTIAESVSQKVTAQIQVQVADTLHKSIIPSFKSLTISTAEKAAAEVEKRMSEQIHQFEVDRRRDVARIERLSQVLQGMAETMQAMSDSQVVFQGQILKDNRQLAPLPDTTPLSVSRQVSTARRSTPLGESGAIVPVHNAKSDEEVEFEEISHLMNEGRYEEGSIKWLQSTQPVELFDDLFVRFTPEYLATDVSPLVAFSIAITVANSLSTNVVRRIEWINTAFEAVDLTDPEIADLSEHAPALLTSLIQKLDVIDPQLASDDPSKHLPQAISRLATKARKMRAELLTPSHGRQPSPGYSYNYGQLDA